MKSTSKNSKEKKAFPIIQKGMDKGCDFANQINPNLGELLRQIFVILLRPVMALRAKMYRTFMAPFRHIEKKGLPIFRLSLILIGIYLMYHKNVSFSFNVEDSMAMVNQVSQTKVYNLEEKEDDKITARTVNEYAPVDAKDLEELSPNEYVKRYKNVAQSEMKKYGIPASITLAQGLIESRGGNSKLARKNNNHFGVKCFSKKCGKGHCTNHFDDNHKDFFRKYNSVWESFRDHSKVLQKDRYKKLKTYGKDYKKWAKGLKKAGYATDKKYDKKLIAVIQKYKLYEYDK